MRPRSLLLAVSTICLCLAIGSGPAGPASTAVAAPQAAPTAAPARPDPNDPIRVVIQSIELDRKVFAEGLDKNNIPIVLPHDIVWYKHSAQPGRGNNVVMWGHVLRFKKAPQTPAPFERLREVDIGAKIIVYTRSGKAYPYVVTEKVRVRPDQVEYIQPKKRERLTLVSCIGDKVIVNGSVEMTQRLITIAEPAG